MRKTDTRREEDGEGGQSHREPRKPKVQGKIETRSNNDTI